MQMLPFGAQGANQAIEDAGALAVVLDGDDISQQNLMHRLAVFEKVRRLRASRIQIMSGVRLGKEKQVQDQIRRYADSIAFGMGNDRLFAILSPMD
jgi:salicylate hydroxylase